MCVYAKGSIGCETSSAVLTLQTDSGTGLHEALLQAGLVAANDFLAIGHLVVWCHVVVCDPWGPSSAHRFCCCARVLAPLRHVGRR